jgi:hypothetical protein
VKTIAEFWSRVSTSATGCWEWQGARNNSGYGSLNWRGKPATAHRVAAYLEGLVMSVAAPKSRKSGGFVLHRCDNRACCRPSHFRIGTYSANNKESYERGRRTPPRGHLHANAKLTPQQVREIRRLYKGGLSQEKIAPKFGVTQVSISNVLLRKTYRNVA